MRAWARVAASTCLAGLLLSPPAPAATLAGLVRAAGSLEPLPSASVSVPALKRGVYAAADGRYLLADLPAGTLRVRFALLGYRPEERDVTLPENATASLDVDLVLAPPEMKGIVVTPDTVPSELHPGALRLEPADLGRVAATGEADVFRALQSLPGVSTLSDYSAGLYVRGGSPDQNLVLLDDVDVYNPSHLFGFLSTFNVDAVRAVDLQKSGFPARFGGRLSSLLDVHDREGDRGRLGGVLRTGLIASTATLDGPWRHGSWLLSGRLTHLGPLTRAARLDLPYGFADLQGRFDWDAGPGDRASVSVYAGRDRLDWNRKDLQLDLGWGNEVWSARWTHVLAPRLFAHTVAGRSRFSSRSDFALSDFGLRTDSHVDDWMIKENLAWSPGPRHQVDLGGEAKRLDFSFRSRTGSGPPLAYEYRGTYAAGYLQDDWRVTDAWRLRAGVRVDHYRPGGFWRVAPRLALERALGPRARAHAGYGRYHQFLNLVSRQNAGFADMWFPVDAGLAPGRADHWLLGFDLGPFPSFALSVEGWLKPYANVAQYSQEFQRSLMPASARMSDLFDAGTGRALGLDVYLRDHWAGFEGWLGYTLGRATRTIHGVNDGRPFLADQDRRHQVVLVQSRGLGGPWRASLTFHFGTGQPLTVPDGRTTVVDATGRAYDVALAGALNTSRLPDYVRLDLSLGARFRPRGWTVEPEIQVVNATNHRNVWIRTYNVLANPAEFSDVTMLPLLPTAGVRVEF